MESITKGRAKDGRKRNEMETMRNDLEIVHFLYKLDLQLMKKHDNLQKVRSEELQKQPRSDMNIS